MEPPLRLTTLHEWDFWLEPTTKTNSSGISGADGTVSVAPNADIVRIVHSTFARPKEIVPTFKRDLGESSDIRLRSNFPRFLLSIYTGY